MPEPVAETTEIEKLCRRWGRWLRSGDNAAGGGGFHYEPPEIRGFDPEITDPTSEVMDKLIARLPRNRRDSIFARHYWEKSDREAAWLLHTNKTAHNRLCLLAYERLEGLIVGMTGKPVSGKDGLEGVELPPLGFPYA